MLSMASRRIVAWQDNGLCDIIRVLE
jgi:hypothetical protein